MIDWTPIVQTLLGLAAAAVSAAIPILVPAVLRRMRLSTESELNTRLQAALTAAAGEAYQFALRRSEGLSTPLAHNQAVGAGASYVARLMPDTLKALGVTDAALSEMVRARLGALLAQDPNITPTRPPEK